MSSIVYLEMLFLQPTENVIASSVLNDFTLLDTSPSTQPVLNPGDVIRASGKFTKPTKIPGKNYTKDEVVIRNADSGKGKHRFCPSIDGRFCSIFCVENAFEKQTCALMSSCH